jgi:hypothetical protein
LEIHERKYSFKNNLDKVFHNHSAFGEEGGKDGGQEREEDITGSVRTSSNSSESDKDLEDKVGENSIYF